MRTKLLSFVFVLTFYAWGPAQAHQHRDQYQTKPKPLHGESIYHLTSRWTDQNGKEMSLSVFRGRPVVLAMIYASCKDACPLLVSDMRKIEKNLSAKSRENVRFILVSFDPDTDTPQKLNEYAKVRGLDPGTWTLLNGSSAAVRELAAICDVHYKRLKAADFEHSNIITILSAEGIIKYQQVGLGQDPKDSVKTIEKL